jgi:hypothetical protein
MSKDIIFKEGLRFPFVIVNKLTLPGTDEVNFVLLGPDQKKYLLPEESFRNYHLKTGQTIQCTIDKINCSGKIFLEPDHPYYKIGERYDFLVLRIAEKENFLGTAQLIAWVLDQHGLEWPCPIDTSEGIEPGYSHLACRVEKIRKAELQLSLPAMTSRLWVLKAGYTYPFRLTDIKTFEDREFYILKDHLGNFHRLLMEFYKDYKFRINQEIQARVVKYSTSGECLLEPEHPVYKTGLEYDFTFIRLEKTVDVFGRIEAVLFVADIFGNEVKLRPESWQVEMDGYQPSVIRCRVDRFRKGRPVLVNRETRPGSQQ